MNEGEERQSVGGGGGGKVIGRRAGEAKVRCMVSGNAVLVPHRAQADDEMGGLRRRCLWRSDVRECESYNILVPDCQGHQSSMPHLVSCQGSNAKIHNLSRQQTPRESPSRLSMLSSLYACEAKPIISTL